MTGRKVGGFFLFAGASLAMLLLGAAAAFARQAPTAGGKCSGREKDPDCQLYLIARKCIDPNAPDYCSACSTPRPGYCPGKQACEETTEVWAANTRFAAIRDIGMCACSQIPHGLVMPLGAVSGIEDLDRPAAIWKFAWDVASGTMDPNQAALIASSPKVRTQSQLHIHVLPIDPNRMASLEAAPAEIAPDAYAVWAKADALAKTRGLSAYGILTHRVEGGLHVHVEDAPLTTLYTTLPDCERLNPKKKKGRV